MANCVITIEIKEYHPENLNYDNFSFIFHSAMNKFEDEISLMNKNSVLHRASTKKDIKYSIKITKAKSLIGITDFIIPQTVLLKREETYFKLCQVTMTESIRKTLLGNNWLSDSLKIMIHATIQYIKKPSSQKQSHSLPRTEDIEVIDKIQQVSRIQKINSEFYERANKGAITPPLDTLKIFTYKKPLSTKKSTSQNRSIRDCKKNKIDHDAYNTNISCNTTRLHNQNSDDKALSFNKETIGIVDLQNSSHFHIDNINENYNDFSDSVSAFHSIANKHLNDISKAIVKNDINNDNVFLRTTKDIISKIMIIQTEYHQRKDKSLKDNNSFRTQIVIYNEHYNHAVNKRYELDKRNQALDFKLNIANDILDSSSRLTDESISIANGEIKLYQTIFDRLGTKHNIHRMKIIEKQNKDERLLSSILKNILQLNGNVIKDIPQSMQGSLSHLISKYSFQYLLSNNDLLKVKSNKLNSRINNEQREQGKQNKSDGGEEDDDEEEVEKKLEECDTVHVISDAIDETDIKLDRYLNYFYSKRKIVKIPLKKTSPFNYEYGSQKIMIKSEGETFRVKHIGKYTILDKFIEINAPIEEERMKNATLNRKTNKNSLTKKTTTQTGSGSKSQRSNK